MVLVDSVVVRGKTVVEFVQAIRKLHKTVTVFVAQAQCVSMDSPLDKGLAGLVTSLLLCFGSPTLNLLAAVLRILARIVS